MLIIATVGPKTKEKHVLRDIIYGGANMLRFNFSHGNVEEFDKILSTVRGINKDINILLDLSGSKIRVSDKLPYILKVYNGEEILFMGEDNYKEEGYKSAFGSKKIIPLNLKSKDLYVNKLELISMKDGTMEFKIISVNKFGILAKVTRGGIVRSGKGCNIKGFSRDGLALSNKDKENINWGIRNSVDIICQSFVESKEDILKVKEYINESLGNYKMPRLWAKVETPKGVDNIEEIIDEVDGILIGRGDLIPESLIELVPIYEEKILKVASEKKKVVVFGTHILNSMKNGRRPELSEVESIYRYMGIGVGGFLLAGETSVGKAPIKTVEFLKKVVNRYSAEVKK